MLSILKNKPWLSSIVAAAIFAIIFIIGLTTDWFRQDILGVILALGAFLIIFNIALTTNILREKQTEENKKPPYSFSRFQLWLWTLVIVPCFCLYWGFSEDHEPTLNTTGIILLGISIGTTFTSGVVSNTQEAAKRSVQTSGKQEKDPDLHAQESNVPPRKLKYEQESKGFWEDLLMDDNMQFSVGRLQQLVFTCIYVVIYLTTFIHCKMMEYPVFGEQAFYLLGISAGGFIFLKSSYK